MYNLKALTRGRTVQLHLADRNFFLGRLLFCLQFPILIYVLSTLLNLPNFTFTFIKPRRTTFTFDLLIRLR